MSPGEKTLRFVATKSNSSEEVSQVAPVQTQKVKKPKKNKKQPEQERQTDGPSWKKRLSDGKFDEKTRIIYEESEELLELAELAADLLERGDEDGVDALVTDMSANSAEFRLEAFFFTLLQVSAQDGNTMAAGWVVDRLSDAGHELNHAIFNALLEAGSKGGDVDLVEKWLLEMQEHGLEPDAHSYHAVITACAEASDGFRAHYWFDYMLSVGVEPWNPSFSCVIDAYCRSGNVQQAIAWVRKAGSLDVRAYIALVTMYMKMGDVSGAEFWLGDMEANQGSPWKEVYEVFLTACIHNGAFPLVLQCLERMEQCEAEADDETVAIMFEAAQTAGNAFHLDFLLKQQGWLPVGPVVSVGGMPHLGQPHMPMHMGMPGQPHMPMYPHMGSMNIPGGFMPPGLGGLNPMMPAPPMPPMQPMPSMPPGSCLLPPVGSGALLPRGMVGPPPGLTVGATTAKKKQYNKLKKKQDASEESGKTEEAQQYQ